MGFIAFLGMFGTLALFALCAFKLIEAAHIQASFVRKQKQGTLEHTASGKPRIVHPYHY